MVTSGMDTASQILGQPPRRRTGGRSSFGKQPLSSTSSAPSWGIGSSSRAQFQKQYLSADHARVMPGNSSPGSVYNISSSIDRQALSGNENSSAFSFGSEERLSNRRTKNPVPGPGSYKVASSVAPQCESTKKSAPQMGFGSSVRDSNGKVFITKQHDKVNFGVHSPGPSQYTAGSGMGTQHNSRKSSAPAFQQGKSGRFQYDYVKRAEKLPGAGQYIIQSTVGSQADSKKRSMPKFSFGSGTRDASNKLFLSVEHEKGMQGMNSPGPMTSVKTSSMGRQVLSTAPSRNGHAFGMSKRQVYQVSSVPGPGHYD